jgi:hypothetical protein
MFRIFITDLAAYNNGHLVGRWIDLEDMSKEELRQEIQDILEEGTKSTDDEYPHEEIFITDFDNDLEYSVEEYEDPFELLKMIQKYEKLDEEQQIIFRYLCHTEGSPNFKDIECYTAYANQTFDEYAWEVAENMDADQLLTYIDLDKLKRDLEIEGTNEFEDSIIVQH